MNDAELTNAAWYAWFLSEVEHWAFLAVVVALAIEFAALKFGAPYKVTLDSSRELKIAELNNETARLKQKLAPRQLDIPAFVKSLDGKPKAPIDVLYIKDDTEGFTFAQQIVFALRGATWEVKEPTPIPAVDHPYLKTLPAQMSIRGNTTGVTVTMRAVTQQDFRDMGEMMPGNPPIRVKANTPFNALADAFLAAIGTISQGTDDAMPIGVLRVIVGPKP